MLFISMAYRDEVIIHSLSFLPEGMSWRQQYHKQIQFTSNDKFISNSSCKCLSFPYHYFTEMFLIIFF